MENIVFTQLSITEFRQLLRQEVTSCLASHIQANHNSLSENKQLLSTNEAAKLLKLAKPTIYGLCSRNSIPHSKKGNRLYFSEKELIEWVRSGRQKTQAETQQDANSYMAPKKKRYNR